MGTVTKIDALQTGQLFQLHGNSRVWTVITKQHTYTWAASPSTVVPNGCDPRRFSGMTEVVVLEA